MASLATGVPPPAKEVEFKEFYTEVKEIEKRDSVLTPKQQIDRLLRPGSTYFNLNPFEVLQLEPETSLEEAKKKYKRLSILVHPDKNQDDPERAQQAFEIINKAWKTLENPETKAKCMDVIEEARAKTDYMIAEKRKRQKREGRDSQVEEDDPAAYRHAVYVMTMKLFADMERRRRELEIRDTEERKRKREQEIAEEEKVALEKEWQKNFEESQQNRVNSWKAFQAGSKKGSSGPKTKKLKTFKPPKHKAESR
ncbi:dnaJ homolog subfamily C member 8 [Macrosteles quadrilineatus]|uniref:dnaJ homolog subfamily C member 8 n=1 Tax=Macrosteles quadrilineatus TaxID=74068 RepID=UPI0023E1BD39|nr:dnaJ homolog subfamily C member 8 [Macrosteles quadrilineatus]